MSIIYGGHVDIINTPEPGRRRRRTFDPAFKAELVATCQYPGVSVAAIALEHGLNANLLRRWITEHERYGHRDSQDERAVPTRQSTPVVPALTQPLPAPFVPVSMTPEQNESIRLDITRGAATMRVEWPMSGAGQCVALLREWLR